MNKQEFNNEQLVYNPLTNKREQADYWGPSTNGASGQSGDTLVKYESKNVSLLKYYSMYFVKRDKNIVSV